VNDGARTGDCVNLYANGLSSSDMESPVSPETDTEGNTRGFSVSSAPYEDTIMVTTRLRDTAFKRVLKTMP